MALGETYKPDAGGPFTPVLPSILSPTSPLSGNGSPEGVVPGVPGHTWHDLLTDNLWLKVVGVQTIGWQLIGKVPA
jgi:hypothetical protein